MKTSIIRGARVLDIATHQAPYRDVLVQDGRIAAIGPPELSAPDDAVTIEAADRMLIPGLINAHSHGHGALAKGLGDAWNLELLLNAGPWINAGRTLEDKYLSAQLNAAELVRKGCTAVYDLYTEFPVPTIDGIKAVSKAYDDVGMRAVIAPMVADRSLFQAIPGLIDSIPDERRESITAVSLAPGESIINACRSIFAGWTHDRARLQPALAPTIPLHCSEPFLKTCVKLAKDFDLCTHTHLAESRVQAAAGVEAYGKSVTAYLDDLGMLGPNLTAAHCVWLDQRDIALIADRGCSVAHNPGSNLRLGSGIAPARQMLARGVNIGIGTDGSHCSDDQNIFTVMRLASFVSRAASADPAEWITTSEAAHMATVGGASALGLKCSIGVLDVGYAADIVFLDLGNINFVPFNDPTNQLVHSEDSSSVESVMIGGEWVLKERRFTKFDYSRLRTKVDEVVERLRSTSAHLRTTADGLARYVTAFCIASHRRPYHINRLCTCGGVATSA